jgi:phosphocarrier protein
MKEIEVRVVNLRGLHARAAARLVQTASRFQSQITLLRDNLQSDAKSILGVLLLAAPRGTLIRVRVSGPDEDQAVEAIRHLFESGFEETDEDPAR